MNEAATDSRLIVTEDCGLIHVRFRSDFPDGSAVRELYETASVMVRDTHVRLLVDFTGVGAINSGLMGMMVTLKKRCMSEGAQFHIALPGETLRKQFELMNLHLLLAIFESPQQALARFKPV